LITFVLTVLDDEVVVEEFWLKQIDKLLLKLEILLFLMLLLLLE